MAGNKNSGRKKIAPPKVKRLTTTEIANLTGFSGDAIRKFADMDDGIPHIRIFSNRWFIESEVLNWFAERNINTPKQKRDDDGA